MSVQISRFGFVPFFALATQCRALKTRRWFRVPMRCQLGCFTPLSLRNNWLIYHRRPRRF